MLAQMKSGPSRRGTRSDRATTRSPMPPQLKAPQTRNIGEVPNATGFWIDGRRSHLRREVRGSFLMLGMLHCLQLQTPYFGVRIQRSDTRAAKQIGLEEML